MKTSPLTPKQVRSQRSFAKMLLNWSNGESGAIYAVGMTIVEDCKKGQMYHPCNHPGHRFEDEALGLIPMAIRELLALKGMVDADERRRLNKLAYLLARTS